MMPKQLANNILTQLIEFIQMYFLLPWLSDVDLRDLRENPERI